MSELYGTTYRDRTRPQAISATQLLGQVMFLVAVAVAFTAFGTWVGRDLEVGTARLLSFAGFGMLLVSSFAGARFRVGAFAMGWLFATALVIGLGLGPVVWSLAAGSISPVVSGVIYLLSAALIVVDFNYLRKHGTENDAIWLATGIFVSIVNIFVSLLNIFSSR